MLKDGFPEIQQMYSFFSNEFKESLCQKARVRFAMELEKVSNPVDNIPPQEEVTLRSSKVRRLSAIDAMSYVAPAKPSPITVIAGARAEGGLKPGD